jgi:NitT/TauT family transport system ATP-binding protein
MIMASAETCSPKPPAPLLSVQRVDKCYPNGTVALEDVRLSIEAGEFISLLGPSGCGKSTLLKMFAGIETPTHGHMRWWGQPFDTVGSTGRRMSMVFQEATLMPWATVADNVRLPLDLAHVPRREADARVAEALDGVGLAKFGKVLPRELSGGMRSSPSRICCCSTNRSARSTSSPATASTAICARCGNGVA